MLVTLLVSAPFLLFRQEPAPAPAADGVAQIAAGLEPHNLPLKIEDVVRLVAENAPAIRQAHLAALADAGGVLEAQGLFDPVLFGDLTYDYAERPNSGGFLSGGISNTHTRTWQASQGLRGTLLSGGTVSVGLSERYAEDNLPASFFGFNPESNVAFTVDFTQPLLKGGWELNSTYNLRSAELNYQRGLAGLRQAAQDAVQAAVDAYWDLAFALEDVKVKELSLRLAEELREVTLAKFRVGSAAEVEVVQTDADIAARTEALLTARNDVRRAEDRLRTLLFALEEQQEWNFTLLPVSDPPAPQAAAVEWEQAFEVARRERSDLLQLRLDLDRASLDWEVARRNLLPRLDLTASGNSLGVDQQIAQAFDPIFEFISAGYSLGLAVEFPLGNRGARGTERRARLFRQLAQRGLRDQENAVAAEVRDAVRSVNYLAERVAATTKAREVAQRQLEAEQRRLREGASTNFQVLQFQEDLEQALTSEQGARMEYAKAAVRLHTVQGLNWDGSAPEQAALEAEE